MPYYTHRDVFAIEDKIRDAFRDHKSVEIHFCWDDTSETYDVIKFDNDYELRQCVEYYGRWTMEQIDELMTRMARTSISEKTKKGCT